MTFGMDFPSYGRGCWWDAALRASRHRNAFVFSIEATRSATEPKGLSGKHRKPVSVLLHFEGIDLGGSAGTQEVTDAVCALLAQNDRGVTNQPRRQAA